MSIPDHRDASASASASASSATKHSRPPCVFPTSRKRKKVSDEELFTVPDLGAEPSSSKASPSTPVRRGRNPQDREHRRLKRLLRNRVSAQQARERKKVYVSDLESMAKVIRDKNAKLAEKISTLVNENSMLRKVLVNMRPKADEGEGAGTLDDQLGNSGSSFS
ncbi:unnamed protein product [Spirodela intermedia]|uniref:BZIP domain-containing protein n=1 Tax=Spirodela intermedia TaxID=51605 RepID=A0A7I8I844_SPIIN|nr:unnamed protein product [Spirodela intermedia]CAA6653827.1 unnamed protein product [Spirodela intermedia]